MLASHGDYRAAATEAEAQGLVRDEATLNATAEVSCALIDVPSPFALSTWDGRAALPEPNQPPDLTRWLSDLSEPPPEPLGVWEKREPYKDSLDLHERLPALLYLFWLAHARARQEYVTREMPTKVNAYTTGK